MALSPPFNWPGLAAVVAAHLVLLGGLALLGTDAVPAPPPPTIVARLLSAPIPAATLEPEPDAVHPDVEPAAFPQTPAPRRVDPRPVTTAVLATATPAQHPPAVAPVPAVADLAHEPANVTASAAVTEPASPSGSPAPLEVDDDELRRYVGALMRELNRHKKYARHLKKARIEGTVVLQFSVDRRGRLLAARVQRSSGQPELDQAALEMIAAADPLPAIPAAMNRDELALAIPVEYSLITNR
jgi:protein TonB